MKKQPGFLVLTGILVAVYLPAFTTEFGVNNDYSLIPLNAANRDLYPEARHMYSIGRALGATLVTLLGWCVNRISDLTVGRVLAFAGMAGFCLWLDMFLRRRCHVEPFWSRLITLSVMLLPPSQVFILWVTHILVGPLTLLLALWSYFLWDRAETALERGDPPWLGAAVLAFSSFLLFLAALLIYPPQAVFVFVPTFCYLLFSTAPGPAKKKKIIRDVVFYSVAMVIYFILNVKVIIPLSRTLLAGHGLMTPEIEGGVYELGFSRSLPAKMVLAGQIALAAMAGVLHPFWPRGGAAVTAAVLALGSAGIVAARRTNAGGTVRGKIDFLRKVLGTSSAGLILFLLACSPPLVSKNLFHVPGYRVLFCAMVMIMVTSLAVLRLWEIRAAGGKMAHLPRLAAVWLVLSFVLLGGKNVRDVIKHFRTELDFVRQKAGMIDDQHVRRVLINNRQPAKTPPLVGRDLPFELGPFMSYDGWHAVTLNEERKKQGRPPLPIDVEGGDTLFVPEGTFVLDLNELAAVEGVPKPRVKVGMAPEFASTVEVFRSGFFFLFESHRGGGETLPVWIIPPQSDDKSWLGLEFPAEGRELQSFGFGVFVAGTDQPAPVACRVQASHDQQHWRDLTIAAFRSIPQLPYLKLYGIKDPQGYRYYRFYLHNPHPQRPLPVRSVYLMFGNE